MIDDDATEIPDAVRYIVHLYLDQIGVLTKTIDKLHSKLSASTKTDDAMRRLCTVPGDGPVAACAIMAFAPDLRAFASRLQVQNPLIQLSEFAEPPLCRLPPVWQTNWGRRCQRI